MGATEEGESYGVGRRLREMVGCDHRSLAVCRMLLAALLLWDIFVRLQDLDAFYTDQGLLPSAAVVAAQQADGWDFASLHFASGSHWYQHWIFFLAAKVHFMLLVGFHTKLATVLSWVLVTSLHNRQGMNLNGGDLLVRLVLFWAIFMPWGKRWSVDSFLHRNLRKTVSIDTLTSKDDMHKWTIESLWTSRSSCVLSAATLGVLVQFGSMYMFSYGLKIGFTWRDGTALALALQQEQFLTATGRLVRDILFPSAFLQSVGETRYSLISESAAEWLMWALTRGTLWFELLGPFLLCFPVFTQELRLLGVASFALLHMGFGMCLNIGLFMLFPIATATMFLPSLFWNAMGCVVCPVVLRCVGEEAIVYCSPSAATGHLYLLLEVLHHFLLLPHVKLSKDVPERVSLEMARAGSPAALYVRSRHKKGGPSRVQVYTGGRALLEVLRRCPLMAWVYIVAFLPLAGGLTRALLDWFSSDASARPGKPVGLGLAVLAGINWGLSLAFGSSGGTVRQDSKARRTRRMGKKQRAALFWGTQLLVLSFIVFCFYWNVRSLREENVSYTAARVAEVLRLDQWWGMFSPNPPFQYGWFVIPGQLVDGRVVDLMPGSATPYEPPTTRKPAVPSYQYTSQRWRKYLMNLHDVENYDKRVHFGRYLCKAWNWPTGPHYGDDMLVTFEVLFFEVELEPDLSIPQAEAEGLSLWSHVC